MRKEEDMSKLNREAQSRLESWVAEYEKRRDNTMRWGIAGEATPKDLYRAFRRSIRVHCKRYGCVPTNTKLAYLLIDYGTVSAVSIETGFEALPDIQKNSLAYYMILEYEKMLQTGWDNAQKEKELREAIEKTSLIFWWQKIKDLFRKNEDGHEAI